MTRTTIDDLLAAARARIRRYEPACALAAQRAGAVIVDVRAGDDRARDGAIPGALHFQRTVLEWRVDPGSRWRAPDAPELTSEVIVVCNHGWSSSLAAATLVDLGFTRAGDVVGGFEAWAVGGLPVEPA